MKQPVKPWKYYNSIDAFLDVEEAIFSIQKFDNVHYRYHNQRQGDFVYARLISTLRGGFLPVSSFECYIDEAVRQGNEELFEREFPTTWLERYIYIQQRQAYMEHPPLQCYKDLLKLIWNDKQFACSLQNHIKYKSLGTDDCGDVILGLRSLVIDQEGRFMRDRKGRFLELEKEQEAKTNKQPDLAEKLIKTLTDAQKQEIVSMALGHLSDENDEIINDE